MHKLTTLSARALFLDTMFRNRGWNNTEAGKRVGKDRTHIWKIRTGRTEPSSDCVKKAVGACKPLPEEMSLYTEALAAGTGRFAWASIYPGMDFEAIDKSASRALAFGEYPEALPLIEAMADLAEGESEEARVQLRRASMHMGMEDFPKAQALFASAEAIFFRLGERGQMFAAMNNRAGISLREGNLPNASILATYVVENSGDGKRAAYALQVLGRVHAELGKVKDAERLLTDSEKSYWSLAQAATDAGTADEMRRRSSQARLYALEVGLKAGAGNAETLSEIDAARAAWGPAWEPIDAENFCRASGLFAKFTESPQESRQAAEEAKECAKAHHLNGVLDWLKNLGLILVLFFGALASSAKADGPDGHEVLPVKVRNQAYWLELPSLKTERPDTT